MATFLLKRAPASASLGGPAPGLTRRGIERKANGASGSLLLTGSDASSMRGALRNRGCAAPAGRISTGAYRPRP